MSKAFRIIVAVALAALAALLVLVAGCGSSGGTSSAPAPAQKASSSPSGSASSPSANAKPSEAAKPAPTTPEGILAELAKLPPAERQKRLEEGAKKEGKVVAYAVGDIDAWEAFKRDFQKKYPGVTFEFLREGGDQLLQRMQAETQAGKLVPDLVHHNMVHVLQDMGIVIPYTSPAKEALSQKFRDDVRADTDVNPIVIAWNTNLVKPEDAPKKWEDLLDPKWKGRKMALDANPDTMMYGFYNKWGVEKGREFLRKLLAQDLIPSRSHTTALDQLAAGEFPMVAEAYGYRAVAMARGKGAPIGWLAPDPMPTTGGALLITKTAAHPYAAALFYDYMLSPEAGTLYGTFGRISSVPGAQLLYPEYQRSRPRDLWQPGQMSTGSSLTPS